MSINIFFRKSGHDRLKFFRKSDHDFNTFYIFSLFIIQNKVQKITIFIIYHK